MIVVDVETGGVDPTHNPLLSIGAVDLNNLDTFYVEMKPWDEDQRVTQDALKVNGQWHYKQNRHTVPQAMTKFKTWLWGRDTILAGHNPSFDISFLNYNFARMKQKPPFGFRTVDLHSVAFAYCMAKGIAIPDKMTSDAIYNLLGMIPEPRPHHGLNGALWEATAFLKIFKELK